MLSHDFSSADRKVKWLGCCQTEICIGSKNNWLWTCFFGQLLWRYEPASTRAANCTVIGVRKAPENTTGHYGNSIHRWHKVVFWGARRTYWYEGRCGDVWRYVGVTWLLFLPRVSPYIGLHTGCVIDVSVGKHCQQRVDWSDKLEYSANSHKRLKQLKMTPVNHPQLWK